MSSENGVDEKAQLSSFFDEWTRIQLLLIEEVLGQAIHDHAPDTLMQAMRYAVLGGGKRLRPLLVLATAQTVGADAHSSVALRAACAAELIHAYSLVHDDMPCMDNDSLRRGLPTVHVKFGDAMAMLAGDALQALAFEVLTADDEREITYQQQAKLAYFLSRAAGTAGMAGGQAIDLLNVGNTLSEQALQKMHEQKTGALLKACVEMGLVCSPAPLSEQTSRALVQYAHCIGLAFQVVDDILDVTEKSEVIGKTAGKDANADKPTYVTILGLDVAKARAMELYHQAMDALEESQLEDTRLLRFLADQIVSRSY